MARGKHRGKGNSLLIVVRQELFRLRNRWYAFTKPAIRAWVRGVWK